MGDTLLIVDDDQPIRFALTLLLKDAGFVVVEAPDGRVALEILENRSDIDLVITDLQMPVLDGMGLLAALSGQTAAPPVIMITAHGDERTAVEALQRGAIDYFSKPFEEAEILRVVERNLTASRAIRALRQTRASRELARHMVFESASMIRVAELVHRVAPRDIAVLITGPSGTGKELVARAIVSSSRRARAPFHAVNCAALPAELIESELFGHVRGAFTGAHRDRAGVFRRAQGGTVLLDEVGDLSPRAQGALLRVLQERKVRAVGADEDQPVDVRVLAATHRDLSREDGFRRDLYFRLKVLEIKLPALDERPEDIVPLARHFTAQAAKTFDLSDVRLSQDIESLLRQRRWPGNVRELRHVVESLVAITDDVVISRAVWEMVQATPPAPDEGEGGLKEQVARFERGLLVHMLDACEGNQSEAARRLQISRLTLSSKLKKYGLR